MRAVLRIAHRGDWRGAPENSLAALIDALALPACDGLEFDVRAARDGTPVLLHDRSLLRVQGVDAAVDELSVAELAAHGVPTLGEVLAAVGPAPFLDVELKDDPGPGVIDVLDAARGPDLANTVVSSFEPGTVARIRAARPGWACWLNADALSEDTLRSAIELGCAGVAVGWRSLDGVAMERARAAGLDVCAWTVRDVGTLERVAALGVFAVCVEDAALDG